MVGALWRLARESVAAYVDDGALSRGAAIAYYTVTSIAPVLVIVIAIAGLVFGEAAAQGAIKDQVGGLMGRQSAELLESVIAGAARKSSGVVAGLIGLGTLLVTASGVFAEMQSALNAIWRAAPARTTVGRLVRARLVSLGLVAALGFLLLVSLVISALIAALGDLIDRRLPFAALALQLLNATVSYALIALLFAAIYKLLPDRRLRWRDVGVGALVTALLFTLGKSLIGLYLGSSSMATSYGAAGGLVVLLVWVYYSAQIFLLGAEFTKAYASRYGSLRGTDVAASVRAAAGEAPPAADGPGATAQAGPAPPSRSVPKRRVSAAR